MDALTDDRPLFASLARYVAAMHEFVRAPGTATLSRLDIAFAALRSTQMRDFPYLHETLNTAGETACDLVNTLMGTPLRTSLGVRLLLAAHDRAISRIVARLVPLAA